MANFDQLKAAIRAAIYENTEQAITGDAMQSTLIDMVDALNAAKQDALTLALPLTYDGDGALALNFDAYEFDLGGGDDALTLRLTFGLVSNSSGVQVDAGDGLTFGDEGQLVLNIGESLAFDDGALQVQASRGIFMGGNGIEANIGWGLTWDDDNEDEIAVDDTVVQPIISDLATIRSGAAAGATAYQLPAAGIPASDLASAVQTSLGKADTAVQSATISTIVSLSQQDYDNLVDKDAATLYVII